MRRSSSAGRQSCPNLRVVWGRAEEQPRRDVRRRRREGARQSADGGRVVPAARPGGRRGRALGRALRGRRARVAASPTLLAAEVERARRRASRDAKGRPDARRDSRAGRASRGSDRSAERGPEGVAPASAAKLERLVDEEARQARLEEAAACSTPRRPSSSSAGRRTRGARPSTSARATSHVQPHMPGPRSAT